jgi:HEAT repeat protein
MKTNSVIGSPFVAAAASLTFSSAKAEDAGSVSELIARMKSPDDAVRGPAWQSAGKYGAPAVKPLAELLTHPDLEIARAARRALWKIVRHAGRPGAAGEQNAVTHELVLLLTRGPTSTRRDVVWMLSEIGREEAVPPIAALLFNQELREDARAALQRIPGEKSLAALETALAKVPEDYRPALAVSLRARGAEVRGYPSQKLVPTKKTQVRPVAPA